MQFFLHDQVPCLGGWQRSRPVVLRCPQPGQSLPQGLDLCIASGFRGHPNHAALECEAGLFKVFQRARRSFQHVARHLAHLAQDAIGGECQDTRAFAMRDLANSLSRLCFESRVLLLPGHGTRPADLMVVDHKDWLAHVEAAVAQARRESDRVVLAGFSLGAALALAVAAESPEKVDAVIGLSPAYRLRSNFLARQARWVATFRP